MLKSLLLVVTAVAGVTFAQLPTCAQSCVVLPAACPNPLPDCICKQSDWINNIACCVFANCTSDSDRNAVISYANGICQPVGVTLPTSPSNCNGSTAVSTSGASVSSSIASSASSVASSISSAASSASSAAASASSSALGNRVGVVESAGFVGALIGFFAVML